MARAHLFRVGNAVLRAVFPIVLPIIGLCLAGAASVGCGDAILPSDYAGPPAAAIAGNVSASLPGDKVAKYPMLSVEWLADSDATVTTSTSSDLFGQTLRFVRSQRPDNDWDIDLQLPLDPAKLDRKLGSGRIRLSVGKLVYFDDRSRDSHLDWHCAGTGCDLVKAVSSEYIVFLETLPATATCPARPGALARPTLDRGFHYFRLEGGLPRELRADEPLSFVITDQTPTDSDPSRDLRQFADAFLQVLTLESLSGC